MDLIPAQHGGVPTAPQGLPSAWGNCASLKGAHGCNTDNKCRTVGGGSVQMREAWGAAPVCTPKNTSIPCAEQCQQATHLDG